MDSFEQNFCVIIFKRLDYHLWYGFVSWIIFREWKKFLTKI